MDKFELEGNIYNHEISLEKTWPIEANCPIPLWCLLKAIENTRDDADAFTNKTIENFNKTNFAFNGKGNFGERAREYLKKEMYPRIIALDNYYISCNHLSKEVMELESKEEEEKNSDKKTTLEVLFTRLNKLGTPISNDDLNYSAIKAYWPSIKNINDELSERYMSPSKLVMLAFRLALTDKEDDNLKGELVISDIRSYAKDIKKKEKKEKIITLYKDYLGVILEKIDEWLGVCGMEADRTPSILRTTIAQKSPDVYLLLMYFAYENIKSPIELTSPQIRALAFCLHWFAANNDKKRCVQAVFRRCKEGITLENIQKGISRLMHDCRLLHIYSPEEVRGFVPNIGEKSNWRVWHSVPAPAREFFDRIFWNSHTEPKEMLLYAEREYINNHFSKYDPARQDMWAESNRPWDFDHIVAQDRVIKGSGTRGVYRDYDKKWCESIGNFAAITLESNRSKNNRVDFSEYNANSKSLIYDDAVEKLPDRDLTYNAKGSKDFAQITYNRFCRIYEQVYKLIEGVVRHTTLSDTLVERKMLF